MNYPTNIPLKLLEINHPDYDRLLPALTDIDILVSGGYKLKSHIKRYLPQRPGEDTVTYEHRLSKFTYLNILGTAINEQVHKLANGSLVVSNIPNNNLLAEFRESTDKSNTNEKQLLANSLREALKFKKVYLHVDKPIAPSKPLNKAHEEYLNLNPYVTSYSAFQVTNWYESNGKLDWIKVRQIVEDTSNPLLGLVTKVRYTFIDNKYIVKYGADVELDKYGKITKVNGEYVNDTTVIPIIGEPIQHGFNTIPVVKLELSNEAWVADQAVSKALEHLRIDCAKYDLMTMAYFQRTYKKVSTPDDDLSISYTDSEDKPLPTGLQHVLELDSFEWNEPKGYILPHLMTSLEQIEDQVRDLVSSGGISSSKGSTAQSGESKKVDYYKQEMLLRSYGELLCSKYQEVLQLVLKALGLTGYTPSVTGLNKFENDSLTTLIADLNMLSNLDYTKLKAELPSEAYKLIYADLIYKTIGNVSVEQKGIIDQSLNEKLSNIEVVDIL